MAKPIIEVEKISKIYRLGEIGAGSLRESFENLWNRLRGHQVDSPFEREMRPQHHAVQAGPKPGTFWALKDVSFSVGEGEVIGVIGRNGAGKSTLLKVLSRITDPSAGRAVLRGRVASLLEVGTGFHPELTGRENVYLNGTILGMRKREIDKKFDEIIAFAELDKFLDTPVKHYSSGMYMRLGFAVAAHLQPEILFVDEVLAVGDVEFQKKCLGKIGDVSKEGRTVIFVSHNMTAIRSLCRNSLLLENGSVAAYGETSSVLMKYLDQNANSNSQRVWSFDSAPGNEKLKIKAIRVLSEGQPASDVRIDKETTVEIDYWNLAEGARTLAANIYLLDAFGIPVLSTVNTPSTNSLPESWYGKPHPKGLFRLRCSFPADFLNEGNYSVSLYMVSLGPLQVEAQLERAVTFNVMDTGTMRESGCGTNWAGVVRPRLPWQTEFLGEKI